MTKPLSIPGPKGLNLAALFSAPAGPGPHPFVLMLHGNTGWMEEPHVDTLAEDLAAAGIAALRFDSPGSGKSDGTWADDYRVSNYVKAASAVYDYAVANLPVDRDRAAVWGHSLGGLVAFYTAARHSGRYRAVCGCEPTSGSMTQADAKVEQWGKQGWLDIETEIFGTIRLPYDYYSDRDHFSSAAALADITVPKLFIAGTKDDVVPPVKPLFDATPDPKAFIEFPMDHLYKYDGKVRADVNAATIKFFASHLR